eukprot:TRINITY_DN2687_c0_g1_i2.p1 TRINITY_DN2687_c0_g1~~TRINITY_DN2687_c0_g1_i2.p1  ORF type:complete len:128 (-),score=29.57 TRINITY_DN2687_c0_g1_i2:63-446(-)
MENGEGVELLYDNGLNNANGIIKITCQKGPMVGGLSVTLPPDGSVKDYTIEFKSPAACPVKTGISGGTTFLILLLLVVALYLGGGAFWNHRKGESGLDLIPHKGFWATIPGLVKDGAGYIKSKVRRE